MTQVSIVANMAIVATVVTQQYQQNLGESVASGMIVEE